MAAIYQEIKDVREKADQKIERLESSLGDQLVSIKLALVSIQTMMQANTRPCPELKGVQAALAIVQATLARRPLIDWSRVFTNALSTIFIFLMTAAAYGIFVKGYHP